MMHFPECIPVVKPHITVFKAVFKPFGVNRRLAVNRDSD